MRRRHPHQLVVSPSAPGRAAALRRAVALACALAFGGALALVLAGCGGSSHASNSSTGPPGSVAGRDGGFTTVIPSGFVNGLAGLDGGPVTLQYAAVAPKVNGFRANINVVREPSRGLRDPGTVIQHELAGLKAAAPQAHAYSAIHTQTLDGAPARSIDYLNRPVGGPELHQYQVFAVHQDRIYTVTYTALRSRYGASLSAMRQVLAAWRWT